MKRICAFVFFAAMAAALPSAAQPLGVSYYALQGYNEDECDAALSVFAGVAQPALAVLWGTFGEDTACLQKFFAQAGSRPHIIEIHLANQSCLRNRNCFEGELLPSGDVPRFNRALEMGDRTLVAALQERINAVVNFLSIHRKGNSSVFISTGLEDNYNEGSSTQMLELLKAAQRKTPFFIVGNSVRGMPLQDADYLETHGFYPAIPEEWQGRCIVNNDGFDIAFFEPAAKRGALPLARIPQAVGAMLSQRCISFLWWSGPQGRTEREGTAPLPPRQRRFVLDKDELREINRLLRTFQ